MKYRKKPVVIEAMQWTGKNFDSLTLFCNKIKSAYIPTGELTIETLEGNMTASVGDYIIKGVKGEFYPCKPDIFEATYEEVNE
jgi:hypothetical protein